ALGNTFSSEGLVNPIKTAIVIEYDNMQSPEEILYAIEEIDLENLPPQALSGYQVSIESFDPEEVLFANFLDSEGIQGILQYKIMTKQEAVLALEEGEVAAIITVPSNYIVATHSNLLGYKQKVMLDIITHEGNSYRGTIATQIITAFTDTFSLSIANSEVYNEIGADYATQQEIAMNTQRFHDNLNDIKDNKIDDIKVQSVKQYKVVDSFAYYTAAMLCMFILFSAGIGGRSMLEERENLTYDRMKVLGVTYFQMMVSKLIVVTIICLLQSVVMIGLSSIAFGVNWGNFFSIAVIALTSAIAVGGLGSFIGAISLRSGNYKVANAFDGALIQVLALLGGSYIPLSVLPKFFTTVSKFTVNGQALQAYLKSAQGVPFVEILPGLGYILIFGALFFIAAMILLNIERRKENVITHMA
ncbi:MAG: ABC transporter permease, partial [Clostridiales bacterium]|nr:ABC transporter permease [Clostridiales bacterium]